MDKKQAEKKFEKKKVVGKVGSRKKEPQVKTVKVNTGSELDPNFFKKNKHFRTDTKTYISETPKVLPEVIVRKPITDEKIGKPKRKDSRQAKMSRLEAEVNLLTTERSSLHSIIGGLKAENNDLKDKNEALEEALGGGLARLFAKIDDTYSDEMKRLRLWVSVLCALLFLSVVSHIMLAFYTM